MGARIQSKSRKVKIWVRLGCGLTALAAGCAEMPDSAKAKLVQAEQQYKSNNYPAAQAALDEVIKDYPRHAETADAYYLRALIDQKQSRIPEALRDAQRCIAASKDPRLTAEAHAMAAALLFDSGDCGAASEHFAKALPGLAEQPPTDMVHYRYGICLQRGGDWKAAREQFAAAIRNYPNGDVCERARRLYEWPHDFFSIQCGAFRDKAPAEALLTRLRTARLGVWLDTQSRAGTTLYSVYCGKYTAYDQAKDALPAVRRAVPDAYIVP